MRRVTRSGSSICLCNLSQSLPSLVSMALPYFTTVFLLLIGQIFVLHTKFSILFRFAAVRTLLVHLAGCEEKWAFQFSSRPLTDYHPPPYCLSPHRPDAIGSPFHFMHFLSFIRALPQLDTQLPPLPLIAPFGVRMTFSFSLAAPATHHVFLGLFALTDKKFPLSCWQCLFWPGSHFDQYPTRPWSWHAAIQCDAQSLWPQTVAWFPSTQWHLSTRFGGKICPNLRVSANPILSTHQFSTLPAAEGSHTHTFLVSNWLIGWRNY